MKNSSVHWSYYGGSVTKYAGPEGNKFAWDRKLMEEEEDERRERRRRQRMKVVSCCKQFIAFLFSHVGLAGMVVAYSIMGGFIFKYLEAPHESSERAKITNIKNNKIDEIWMLIRDEGHYNMNKTNFTAEVAKIFLEFQRSVYKSVKEEGWDGTDSTEDSDQQWSFAGALLFAVTVITTIGYGHIAPKTQWGRLVTIVYALVGIPLTFLYLSNIGNFLADCFRLFYKKICCDICCCQKCEREKKRERLRMKRRKLASQRNMLLAQHYNIDRRPPSMESEESICHSLEDIRDNQDSPELMHRSSSAPKICAGGCENSPPSNPPPGDKLYSTLPTPNRRTSISLDKFPNLANNKQGYDRIRAPPPYRPHAGATPNPPSYRQSVTSTDKLLPTDNECDGSEMELRETSILNDTNIRETAIIDSDTDDEKLKQKKQLSPVSHTFSDGFFDRLGDSKETDIVDSDDDKEETICKVPESPKCDNLQPPSLTGTVSRSNSAKSQQSGKSVSLNENADLEASNPKDKSSRKSRKDKSKERGGSKKSSGERGSSRSESKSLSRSKSRKDNNTKDSSSSSRTKKAKKETGSRTKSKDRKELSRSKSVKERNKNAKTIDTLSLPPSDLRKNTQLKRQESKKRSQKISTKRKDTVDRQTSSKSQKSQASSSSTGQTGGSSDQRSYHGSEESFVTAYSESSLCTDEEDIDHMQEVITKQPPSTPAVSFGDDEVTIEMDPHYDYRHFNHQSQMAFLDENFDLIDDDEGGKVTVPITVCLVIIAGYIFAGSVLFTLWEDWDYLTGSYFCFITLSTIGFGDIVPGMKMDAWASHQKLVLCALWLAFGLSLLAMCFNLMQEEVKEKVKWVGNKIGLLKDENEA